MAQLVKNPPAIRETWVGKIPWRRERLPTPVFWPRELRGLEKPVGLQSQTRLSDFHFHALEKEMAAHTSDLVWRIPGTGSLVGCRLWGRTESDTTEAT